MQRLKLQITPDESNPNLGVAMVETTYVRRKEAIRWFGMSERHFDAVVKPMLDQVNDVVHCGNEIWYASRRVIDAIAERAVDTRPRPTAGRGFAPRF